MDTKQHGQSTWPSNNAIDQLGQVVFARMNLGNKVASMVLKKKSKNAG
jgi:hypothetical protein